MKNHVWKILYVFIISCLVIFPCSANAAKLDSKVMSMKTVVSYNGGLLPSTTLTGLIQAYKKYILKGSVVEVSSIQSGYLLTIKKNDELTNKKLEIKILFTIHKEGNNNYLLAKRIVLNGQDGTSADIVELVYRRILQICSEDTNIPFCKEIS